MGEVTGDLIMHDIRPGDIIDWDGDRVVVHHVQCYPTPWRLAGSVSIRYRHTCDGIDWSGFIVYDSEVKLLSRGVAAVDADVRSLLP